MSIVTVTGSTHKLNCFEKIQCNAGSQINTNVWTCSSPTTNLARGSDGGSTGPRAGELDSDDVVDEEDVVEDARELVSLLLPVMAASAVGSAVIVSTKITVPASLSQTREVTKHRKTTLTNRDSPRCWEPIPNIQPFQPNTNLMSMSLSWCHATFPLTAWLTCDLANYAQLPDNAWQHESTNIAPNATRIKGQGQSQKMKIPKFWISSSHLMDIMYIPHMPRYNHSRTPESWLIPYSLPQLQPFV